MKAGRELDAVVAEKVMGWKRVVVPKDYDGLNAGVTLLSPTATAIEWAPKGAYQLWHFCPLYSTDIAAAWRVVEKLIEPTIERHGSRWSVTCLREAPQDTRWIEVDADTAPLAICLAALKAVDVEVPA